jgi:hypothetical protein
MPTITAATCFLLVITWASPLPVYAGEIQGVVWVDGDVQFLHLEQARPEAVWTASLHPGQRVVDYAFVALTVQPETAEVSNTPYEIECWQTWLPVVDQR